MKIDWPSHHQMYITHNGHHTNYESVSEYIDSREHMKQGMDKEELAKCVESNEIWEIQLYPITPISFYLVAASTLERAVELIMETCENDR